MNIVLSVLESLQLTYKDGIELDVLVSEIQKERSDFRAESVRRAISNAIASGEITMDGENVVRLEKRTLPQRMADSPMHYAQFVTPTIKWRVTGRDGVTVIESNDIMMVLGAAMQPNRVIWKSTRGKYVFIASN